MGVVISWGLAVVDGVTSNTAKVDTTGVTGPEVAGGLVAGSVLSPAGMGSPLDISLATVVEGILSSRPVPGVVVMGVEVVVVVVVGVDVVVVVVVMGVNVVVVVVMGVGAVVLVVVV